MTHTAATAPVEVVPDGAAGRRPRVDDQSRSRRAQMAVRRFLGHKPAVIATVILLIMVIYVVLAPITARYGVNEPVFQTTAEQSNRYLPPQSIAWFGTDEIGRDLYSRLIYGTQVSLADRARRGDHRRRPRRRRSAPSPACTAAASTT